MYIVRARPDWHWAVRALAIIAIAGWAAITVGAPPLAEARPALDRLYPDAAVRGFLEAAPRGGGGVFVDPAIRDRVDTGFALRSFLPEVFVGGDFALADGSKAIGSRSADAVVALPARVRVESATAERATVVATGVFRPSRRERGAIFTFFDRPFDLRFELVRREGIWYLMGVPAYLPTP